MKQIVEMDRKARAITDSAQKEKVSSEKEVSERREEIRRSYLEKARQRVTESEPLEREAAEKAWEEKNRKNDILMKKMNDLYAEKGEQWVSEITERIIGGIS
jgi:Zn-dependent peptidase ImmA (M78 family)